MNKELKDDLERWHKEDAWRACSCHDCGYMLKTQVPEKSHNNWRTKKFQCLVHEEVHEIKDGGCTGVEPVCNIPACPDYKPRK